MPRLDTVLLIGGLPVHVDWLKAVERTPDGRPFAIYHVADMHGALGSTLLDDPTTGLVLHISDDDASSILLRENLLAQRPDVTLARLGESVPQSPYEPGFDLTTRASVAASAQWISRALRLRDALSDPHVQKLAGAVEDLPSVPENYRRLRRASGKNGASIADVARIIEDDPSLAVRVLQLANSASFGPPRRVVRLADACSLLGTRHIRDLAMALHLQGSFVGVNLAGFSLEEFQARSISTAQMASAFISDMVNEHTQAAFTCGLIHDIGKFMIARERPESIAVVNHHVANSARTFSEAEFAVTGTTHSEVGALLLQAWGMPFELVEATAFHHYPSMAASRTNQVLAAVHAADVLYGVLAGDDAEDHLDVAFIEDAGLGHRLDAWRETADSFAAAKGPLVQTQATAPLQ